MCCTPGKEKDLLFLLSFLQLVQNVFALNTQDTTAAYLIKSAIYKLGQLYKLIN